MNYDLVRVKVQKYITQTLKHNALNYKTLLNRIVVCSTSTLDKKTIRKT
jgi:hypothetical protein